MVIYKLNLIIIRLLKIVNPFIHILSVDICMSYHWLFIINFINPLHQHQRYLLVSWILSLMLLHKYFINL